MNNEKFFLKNIIFQLSLVMIFFIFLSEAFLRKIVIPNDPVYQNSLIYRRKNAKNTIFGDSSTMQGIYFLDDFKNFSGGADNYQEIEKKIINYFDESHNKGNVIIHLAMNGFSQYRDRKLKDAELNLFFDKQKKYNLLIGYKYYQRRIFEYLLAIKRNKFNLNLENNLIINEDGSATTSQIVSKERLNSKREKSYYYPKENFKNDENYKSLLRTIDYLTKKRIRICFITTPWHKTFRKNQVAMSEFDELRSFYRQFAENKNIPYYDFLEYDLATKYFADEVHLNTEGAKVFTAMVKNSCNLI